MTQCGVDCACAQRYHHTVENPWIFDTSTRCYIKACGFDDLTPYGKDVIPGAKLRYTLEELEAIVTGAAADDMPPELPKRDIESLARALLPALEKRYATN